MSIMGLYSPSGEPARHLESARPEGSETLVRGPLAVAWSPGPLVGRAQVDGITCVLSGYLYDAGDTARSLGLTPTSDAELVAAAYERLGERALLQLRGRFAAVLWDDERQRGVVTSDLFGLEPWYYSRARGGLAFGVTHARLLDLLPSAPGPDRAAVTQWLGGSGCPSGHTLYDGVFHLRPGHLLGLGGEDGEPVRRYWRPSYSGSLTGSRAELADGLRHELERSVRRRLSPRSTGVVFSGGLDSSTVLAAGMGVRPPGSQLSSYSILFPGKPYDEGWKVRGVASALGIEPNAFVVKPQGALWLCLHHLERWRQPLIGVGAMIETASVVEAGRAGVDVVLDGQTGDETLGFSPVSALGPAHARSASFSPGPDQSLAARATAEHASAAQAAQTDRNQGRGAPSTGAHATQRELARGPRSAVARADGASRVHGVPGSLGVEARLVRTSLVAVPERPPR